MACSPNTHTVARPAAREQHHKTDSLSSKKSSAGKKTLYLLYGVTSPHYRTNGTAATSLIIFAPPSTLPWSESENNTFLKCDNEQAANFLHFMADHFHYQERQTNF